MVSDIEMQWRIHTQDQDKVADLARALGVSPLVAWSLMNRGIIEPGPGRDFLSPTLDLLRPERWMAGVDAAADRIISALKKGETIGVHGDYDVDGICAAAILVRFLSSLGAKVVWRLPHRRKEGYGMKPCGVEDLASKGAGLILAVDCGISDLEAVAHAQDKSIDVIVVDHHQVPEELPPALAIINHNQPDCPFHGQELCAAGTAWYLAAAVRAGLREEGRAPERELPNMLGLLDLVSMATIADVVPMTGLNRLLTHYGLLRLNAGKRPGLIQLRRVAGILDQDVSVGKVAFQLAPRINAAGRLEGGEPAMRLLLCEDEKEAGHIADELEGLNRTRQLVEERILNESLSQIESRPGMTEGPAIVVAGQGWHVGVIGIVAGRIKDKFYRPAAVIGVHEGMGKGSLRSIPGINIYKALKQCSHLLEAYGGHPSAAGITIRPEMIERFAACFSEAVAGQASARIMTPMLWVDAEWPLFRLDQKLLEDLAKMKPHGIGNPEPCFCARGVLVKWASEARKNTLIMGVVERGKPVKAVGFRMGHLLPEPGSRLDIVYTPVLNAWEGDTSIELRIKDFRQTS